jgi:lipoprotein-anchoring transpeptidase ErfK/SrfK
MSDSPKKSLKNNQAKNDNKVTVQAEPEQKPESQPKTEPVNWLLPTGGAYPEIGSNDPIWIQVSKENQRVYIMNGNNVIYTMVCSTGLDTSPDTSTPEGTFYIQKERGTSFYNPSEKEGAKYWVSWKNHGEFLFHSVATDKNGNIIESEAEKLGQKASHGCIRLAVSDAKWLYDNVKYNTKVVIS